MPSMVVSAPRERARFEIFNHEKIPMSVSVQCPNCDKAYNVKDESIGARARCKGCGNTFTLSISMDDTGKPLSRTPGKGKGQEISTQSSSEANGSGAPKKIGNYVVQRKLGAGAMGEVYLGRDPILDRHVAVKVLPAALSNDEERLQRFLREAKSAARLTHPNVAAVHQAGAQGRIAYIVMEYVEGTSLDKAISENGPMDWKGATRTVCDAAAGLGAAHDIGLVHRDVKPGNLIQSPDGVTKVVDFGLARGLHTDTQLTQQGTLLGTPAYMAPEQWGNGEVDKRSDLYSLICTYYFLLTGRQPFDAPSLAALGYQHRYEPFPDPREHSADLPDGVCRVLTQGSAKEPSERFQDAKELASELEALLASPEDSPTLASSQAGVGVVVSTHPPSLAASRWKSKRSSGLLGRLPLRARMAAGGVIAAILVGLFLLGVVFTLRTPQGTLVVTVSETDAEILVDGGKVTLKSPGDDEPVEIKIAEGKHELVVRKGGFETRTKEFTAKSGDRVVFHVTLIPLAKAKIETAEVWETILPAGAPRPAIAPFDATQAKRHQEAWAEYLKIPATVESAIGMKMALIPPGEFIMGSAIGDGEEDERPQHQVRITKPFYLGTTEVTKGQWQPLMETQPWKGQGKPQKEGPDYPASYVSWGDAQEFCRRLGEKDGVTYRLPTEAEWEYACRAGTTTAYYFGDDGRSHLVEYAWCAGNAWNAGERFAHRVGQKIPNAFGLYDIHGNLFEWCQDWYAAYYYAVSPINDPPGPEEGSKHVIRSGRYGEGWHCGTNSCCRSADRVSREPDHKWVNIGFRVARSAVGK